MLNNHNTINDKGLTPVSIDRLEDMARVAESIGNHNALDFSFRVRLNGKVYRVSVQHDGRKADIRPASKYRA